jgi:type I restriction enzyme R subunit
MGKGQPKDLFGNCLHKYVITDAIHDQNVRFGIEYVGNTKQRAMLLDINVEEIDKQVLNSEKRINKIVDYIIAYHDQPLIKIIQPPAVSSDNVMQKKAGEHDLRIATIFTYGSNEDSDEAR